MGSYPTQYNPTGAQIPQVPFQQPQNLFRFGEQSIWSSLMFQGGTALANSVQRAFVTPLGQQGQGFANALTIAETNIKEGGRVPSGVAYDVFGVACQVEQATGAADAGTISQPIDTQASIAQLLNIIQNGTLSWDFTQTQIDVCPISLAGAGGGAYGSVSQNAAGANSGHMNNGAGQIWMYRKHPVSLAGASTFSVQARFGSRAAAIAAANSMVLRIVLLGYYKNVIEIG
jgi:hypothetical protein